MAFGKKRLAPKEEEVLENSRWAHIKAAVVAEKRALLVPPPSTPLGRQYLLDATEEVLGGEKKTCTRCGLVGVEMATALTGTCKECWEKIDRNER